MFPIKFLRFSTSSLNCTDSISYSPAVTLTERMYLCRSGSSLEARLSCKANSGTNEKSQDSWISAEYYEDYDTLITWERLK